MDGIGQHIGLLISIVNGAVRKYESVKSFEPECKAYRHMLMALLDVLTDIHQQFKGDAIQGNTTLRRPLNLLRDAVEVGVNVLEKCSKKSRLMVFMFSQEYIGKLQKSKTSIMEALSLLPASGISLQASIKQDIGGLEQSIQALDVHLRSCEHGVAKMLKGEFERGGEDIADRIIEALTTKGIVADKDDFHHQLENLKEEKISFRASKVIYDQDLINKILALSLEQDRSSTTLPNLSSADFDDMLDCGIMDIPMEDPVILVENGKTYDRKNLCRWLLENPSKDPTGTEYDQPLSYCDAVSIRKLLMEKHGDRSYVRFDDTSFKQGYLRAWQEQYQPTTKKKKEKTNNNDKKKKPQQTSSQSRGTTNIGGKSNDVKESTHDVETGASPKQTSTISTRRLSDRDEIITSLRSANVAPQSQLADSATKSRDEHKSSDGNGGDRVKGVRGNNDRREIRSDDDPTNKGCKSDDVKESTHDVETGAFPQQTSNGITTLWSRQKLPIILCLVVAAVAMAIVIGVISTSTSSVRPTPKPSSDQSVSSEIGQLTTPKPSARPIPIPRPSSDQSAPSECDQSLPSENGQLADLQYLDLADKNLKCLPRGIGELTALTRLDIDKNQLTSLPSEIGQMTALMWLDLHTNELSSLPSEIGQLTNLTYLDFGSNQFSSLPSEIVQLTNLQNLYLNGNQLTSLPNEIEQLTSLTYLFVGFNQLSSLPSEIGQLTNLLTLYVAYNELSSLPSEIVHLTNLQKLYLDNAAYSSLPSEIKQFTNLEIIPSDPVR